MKSRVLILLVIVIIGTLQIQESFACECKSNRNYTDIINNSDLVFIGTVNDIVSNVETHTTISTTFDVHSIAKGELSSNQVITNTPLTDCSVDYTIGTTYVVVIYDQDFLSTDQCSTLPLASMEHYDDIPNSLLLAINEPEVPDVQKLDTSSMNDEFTDEQICGLGTEFVNGICHIIETDDEHSGPMPKFIDALFFMLIVLPFFIPGAIIFVVLSKTPRFSRGIRLSVCIPAIIMILYFSSGLYLGWYPPAYA